jgi:hypothetical protein
MEVPEIHPHPVVDQNHNTTESNQLQRDSKVLAQTVGDRPETDRIKVHWGIQTVSLTAKLH